MYISNVARSDEVSDSILHVLIRQVHDWWLFDIKTFNNMNSIMFHSQCKVAFATENFPCCFEETLLFSTRGGITHAMSRVINGRVRKNFLSKRVATSAWLFMFILRSAIFPKSWRRNYINKTDQSTNWTAFRRRRFWTTSFVSFDIWAKLMDWDSVPEMPWRFISYISECLNVPKPPPDLTGSCNAAADLQIRFIDPELERPLSRARTAGKLSHRLSLRLPHNSDTRHDRFKLLNTTLPSLMLMCSFGCLHLLFYKRRYRSGATCFDPRGGTKVGISTSIRFRFFARSCVARELVRIQLPSTSASCIHWPYSVLGPRPSSDESPCSLIVSSLKHTLKVLLFNSILKVIREGDISPSFTKLRC